MDASLEPQLVRWSQPRPPEEHELQAAMETEGLRPYRWSNGPGYVYGQHDHSYHKVLYCARGGIRFVVHPSGQAFDMRPGDRLDLPPRTRHSAYVGSEGVACLEATR